MSISWKKFGVLALVLIAAIVAIIWFKQASPKASIAEKPKNKKETEVVPRPSQPPLRKVEPSSNKSLPEEYPQLSLKTMSRDEAVRTFNENTKRDLRYEWKIPIRFYGKVIDQFDQPVVGAIVSLSWVNLQGTQGVGETRLQTDVQGVFSFQGTKGKRLNVRISKEGYYDMSLKENQTSFEYANPAEQIFHEPDSNHPVTFRMRKKGELPSLIVKSVELNLKGQGVSGTLDFLTGKVAPSGGQLEVTVWKPEITVQQINEGRAFPYDWAVVVKINNGGLIEHKEAFPFEAPASGYLQSFELREHVTNGADGGFVNKQFYFYFGQPVKYGRMNFHTSSDQASIFIDYWLNPSGSRNLEYDPQKEISPQRIAEVGLEKAIEEAKGFAQKQKEYEERFKRPQSGK